MNNKLNTNFHPEDIKHLTGLLKEHQNFSSKNHSSSPSIESGFSSSNPSSNTDVKTLLQKIHTRLFALTKLTMKHLHTAIMLQGPNDKIRSLNWEQLKRVNTATIASEKKVIRTERQILKIPDEMTNISIQIDTASILLDSFNKHSKISNN